MTNQTRKLAVPNCGGTEVPVSQHFIQSSGDTLQVTFEGSYGAAQVTKFLLDLRNATSKWGTYKFFICDVSRVTSTSSDIHRPSQEVLTYLRSLGVEWMIVVSPAAILSMIIRTTAFVTRLHVRVVDGIPEAKAEIARLRPQLAPVQVEPKAVHAVETTFR